MKRKDQDIFPRLHRYLEIKNKFQLNELIEIEIEVISSENCIICGRDMESTENSLKLDCNHTFHIDCIELMINQNYGLEYWFVCNNHIDLTKEQQIYIKQTPKAIIIHYYFIMLSFLTFTNLRICFNHTVCKYIRISINIIIELVLLILSIIANIQLFWALTFTLLPLIFFQQLFNILLNEFNPKRITSDQFLSMKWKSDILLKTNYFIFPHSIIMIYTTLLFSLLLFALYFIILDLERTIVIIIFLSAILFKLFMDIVIDGFLLQVLIFLWMLLYDLIILLPSICYFVIFKNMQLKKLILLS